MHQLDLKLDNLNTNYGPSKIGVEGYLDLSWERFFDFVVIKIVECFIVGIATARSVCKGKGQHTIHIRLVLTMTTSQSTVMVGD